MKIQKSIGPQIIQVIEDPSDQETGGQVFDVFTPFTLKSVSINMQEPGYLVVRAVNGNRGFVGNKIFDALEAGPQRIDLDFEFSPGENQRLFVRLGGPQNVA